MSAHRIHLKGPWDYEWLGPIRGVATVGRARMPCEWRLIFGERAGRARFARRFHQPTGLEPGDVVRLVFDGLGGAATFRLNDELLVPPLDRASAPTREPQSLAFEVTSLLRAANRLVVEIEFDPGAAPAERGGLFGPVAIDICTQ